MYDDERVRDAILVVVKDEFRFPTLDVVQSARLVDFLDLVCEVEGRRIFDFDGWKVTAWTCDDCDGRHAGLVLTREFVEMLKGISLRHTPVIRFDSPLEREEANVLMLSMAEWFEAGNDA